MRRHQILSNSPNYLLVTVLLCCRSIRAHSFSKDIHYIFYNNESLPIFDSNSLDDDLTDLTGCSPDGELAVIVHGWRENCRTPWVPELVKNLNEVRGGCIVCMDYGEFARFSYFHLLTNFDGIANALTVKLRHFRQHLFEPNKMFMFGFSFGGQLVLEAGRRFGERQIQQIDACEPAGPGFDGNATFQRYNIPQASALNVQCIHTSSDKGTARRLCHQDWMMGYCGWSQAAAGPRPLGSHGLCPYIYNNAFHNRFPAVKKPNECPSTDRVVPMDHMEGGYYMGYNSDRTNEITGDLYASTFKEFPFNLNLLATTTFIRPFWKFGTNSVEFIVGRTRRFLLE